MLPGEHLLWMGRPPQGWLWRSGEWVRVAMSGVMLPVVAGWVASALGLTGRGGFNPCPAILGLLIFALVLYLAVGRFFYDRYQRAHAWYALSDRRVLILYTGSKLRTMNG